MRLSDSACAPEPVLPARKASEMEACLSQLERRSHSTQLDRSPCSKEDPAQPKIYVYMFSKKYTGRK